MSANVLVQPFHVKYTKIRLIEKQMKNFSQYMGFKYYVDRRVQQIQVYDNSNCHDRMSYIQENLNMIVHVAMT